MEIYTKPEAPWQELGGGTRRRIRSYDDRMMMVEVNFDEGGIGADHAHPHTQITYCLEGEFAFHIGDTPYTLRKGDTIVFPANAVHGCKAVKSGTLLDVFTPKREDFLPKD